MLTPEAETLLSYLDGQRNHVLGSLEGLSDADLRRAVLPSSWSGLALVNHLAVDVEQFWFQGVVAGVTGAQGSDTEPDGWHLPVGTTASTILDGYRESIATANRIIAETPLDQPAAWWPEYFPNRHRDLRETIVHVLTETATHAGHLDAVRELIDGRTWLVL